MQTDFVGRAQELELLERLWEHPRSRMLVIYGRRRVGKSRLITQWIKSSGRRALFWTADPDSKAAQLRSFSQALFNFSFPGSPAPETFTYASWDQAFQQVAALAQSERLCLAIDEFTYLLQTDMAMAGRLQRIWDQLLEGTNLFLIISGSHLGMMQRGILSYQAPLYGRASSTLHLQPLSYGHTQQFFPGYKAEDRVAIYSTFGGIPAYWNLLDGRKSLTHNLIEVLLKPGAVMESEGRLLLQDFLDDTHNYITIMRAIAHGNNTPKQMEAFTGIDNVHISSYLSKLVEVGYIHRYETVTARNPTRTGRYYIIDPYLRFYFRFLASRSSQLAMQEPKQTLEEITQHMPAFIGSYTWEELCREWVLRASNRGILPVVADRVESAWLKDCQVDVAGINFEQRTMILGECKWTSHSGNVDILEGLVAKTEKIIPEIKEGQHWKILFLGFSRDRWTQAAQAFVKEKDNYPGDGSWQPVGFQLLTLEDVDRDLCQWANPNHESEQEYGVPGAPLPG